MPLTLQLIAMALGFFTVAWLIADRIVNRNRKNGRK